jgi:hypothetical protein
MWDWGFEGRLPQDLEKKNALPFEGQGVGWLVLVGELLNPISQPSEQLP